MSSREIVIFKSYIRQKSKLLNFRGYETRYPSRDFFRLFSFKNLISGLISTIAIFLFCLYQLFVLAIAYRL